MNGEPNCGKAIISADKTTKALALRDAQYSNCKSLTIHMNILQLMRLIHRGVMPILREAKTAIQW